MDEQRMIAHYHEAADIALAPGPGWTVEVDAADLYRLTELARLWLASSTAAP